MPSRMSPSLPPGISTLPQPISTPPRKQRDSVMRRIRVCRNRPAVAPPSAAPASKAKSSARARREVGCHTGRGFGKHVGVSPGTDQHEHEHKHDANDDGRGVRRPDVRGDAAAQAGAKSFAAGATGAPPSMRRDHRSAEPPHRERREDDRTAERDLPDRRHRRRRFGSGRREHRADAEAAGEETHRRHQVSPFARAEAGDRAEHAGAVDPGAEAEQRRAEHGPARRGVAAWHGRQEMQRVGHQQAAGDPERGLDECQQARHASFGDQFVDRGDGAGATALDGEAHRARAQGGDNERGAGKKRSPHCHLQQKRTAPIGRTSFNGARSRPRSDRPAPSTARVRSSPSCRRSRRAGAGARRRR